MHRQVRFVGWVIALLAVALLASACGRSDDEGGGGGGGGGGGSDPGITDKEIKLGGSYPFSGPAARRRSSPTSAPKAASTGARSPSRRSTTPTSRRRGSPTRAG